MQFLFSLRKLLFVLPSRLFHALAPLLRFQFHLLVFVLEILQLIARGV